MTPVGEVAGGGAVNAAHSSVPPAPQPGADARHVPSRYSKMPARRERRAARRGSRSSD